MLEVICHVWSTKIRAEASGNGALSGNHSLPNPSSSASLPITVDMSDVRLSMNWGHASIEVKDSSISVMPLHYWSYWPTEKTEGDGYTCRLVDDIGLMGGKPDYSIILHELSVSHMEKLWDKEFRRRYHLRNHNCCVVVTKLLKEGYDKSCDYWGKLKDSLNFYKSVFSNPRPFVNNLPALAAAVYSGVIVINPAYVLQVAQALKQAEDFNNQK
jgi:hypothetical protein